MGGKRHEKKQRPRGDELREKLTRLHARGAWGEYLAVAHRTLASPAGSSHAPHYLAVVDSAITTALASGDVGRVAELAAALAHRAAGRPLVSLASAVADLAAGNTEQARAALAAFAAVASPAQAGVVADLGALAGADSAAAPASLPPAAQDLLALDRLLAGGDGGGRTRKRSGPALTTPFARAIARLAGVLAELSHAGFTVVERRQVTALHQTAAALRDAPGTAKHPAVNEVAGAVDLLADLASGLMALRRRPEASPIDTLFSWLMNGPCEIKEIERLLEGNAGAGLVRHLRLVGRMIWWRMIELATGGDAGPLAELLDTYPALVAPHVVPASEAPEGWHAAQQERHRAASALNGERYLELADLLAATTRREGDAGRLASLWALELIALQRASVEELDDGFDDDADSPWDAVHDDDDRFADDGEDPEAAQLNARILNRLVAIAGQLGRSVPAGQRAAVAHVLRAHLFLVAEETVIGLPVARAAAALLEHLPDDPALLLAAEAGFVCGGSRREAEAVARRIAARGATALVDPEATRLIIEAISGEDPRTIDIILTAVRPLFPTKEWASALRPIAAEVASVVTSFLDGNNRDTRVNNSLSAVMKAYSPNLEGVQLFEAVRAVVELVHGAERGRAQIEAYCSRFPSLAALLDLLKVAFLACAHASETEQRVVRNLAAAATDRLGPNWETWLPFVPILVAATEDTPAAVTLHQRLRAVLHLPDLPDHAKVTLQLAVDVTGERLYKERRSEREGTPKRRPGSKRARGSKTGSGGEQLKLDL